MQPFPKPLSCRQKPDIDYPCRWLYKVIGLSSQELIEAINQVCGREDVTVSPSNTSSSGKYCSFNVEMLVADEAARLAVYANLKKHAAVRVIL